MGVDELIARYKALEAQAKALDSQHGPAAEAEQAAISGRMADACDAILDALLGPGGSGRPAC